MRVLIGCECSGNVRDAFLAAGHDAWSCDLKPCEKGSNRHIVADVLDVLKHPEIYGRFDLVIPAPPRPAPQKHRRTLRKRRSKNRH